MISLHFYLGLYVSKKVRFFYYCNEIKPWGVGKEGEYSNNIECHFRTTPLETRRELIIIIRFLEFEYLSENCSIPQNRSKRLRRERKVEEYFSS